MKNTPVKARRTIRLDHHQSSKREDGLSEAVVVVVERGGHARGAAPLRARWPWPSSAAPHAACRCRCGRRRTPRRPRRRPQALAHDAYALRLAHATVHDLAEDGRERTTESPLEGMGHLALRALDGTGLAHEQELVEPTSRRSAPRASPRRTPRPRSAPHAPHAVTAVRRHPRVVAIRHAAELGNSQATWSRTSSAHLSAMGPAQKLLDGGSMT